MSRESYLKLRKEMKSKKPDFERQDSNRYDSFVGKWKRPRGIQSKMRKGFRGHKRSPAVGYASPKSVRGLIKNGLEPIKVSNLKDLDNFEKDCIAVISSTVGMKKKLEILKLAKEKNVTVLGGKDLSVAITKLNQKFDDRKKQRKKREDKVEKKEKELEAKQVEETAKEIKKEEKQLEIRDGQVQEVKKDESKK